MNLGVRYDLQYHSFNNQLDFTGRESLKQLIDPPTRHDNNNIGPRVGMAWDVSGNDRRRWYGRPTDASTSTCRRAGCATSWGRSCRTASASRTRRYPDPYGGLSPQAFVTVTARPNVNILDDNINNM